MAVLNLSANEPYTASTTSADSSALFPSAPVYARTPAKKSSSNLPLLIGLPVLAVAAGGLAWGLMGQSAQAPTNDEAPPAQVAEATPTPVAQTPAPMPTPAPVAATPTAETPAPTQIARAETAPPPRVTTPAKRAALARRAAPQTTPDAADHHHFSPWSEAGGLLDGPGHREHRALVQRLADDLQAQRQAVGVQAGRQRQARQAGQVRTVTVNTSFRYMAIGSSACRPGRTPPTAPSGSGWRRTFPRRYRSPRRCGGAPSGPSGSRRRSSRPTARRCRSGCGA
jgi:type IV secretory pathway VirB10-like protein